MLALLVGGGAFVFYKTDPFHLFTAGPQAAEALPADALFYLGVDADPSARQKIDAVRFLNHFPYFKEHSGLADENSDVRASVFQKVLDAAGCTGVTYDDTVKPWLGRKFGLAMMPGDGQTSTANVAIAVETTDEVKARTGLGDLASCSAQSGGNGFGYAFENNYVLLAATQNLADQYAQDAASTSLADSSDFNSDMDSLGELGVATVWVDVRGLVDQYSKTTQDNGLFPYDVNVVKNTYGRAAATFRFGSDNVEIATSIFGDTTDISHPDNQIVDLPDTTVFAVSDSGGAERVKASWDMIKNAAASGGANVDQQISDFESQTGFALPEDLETIVGDNLMFAIDSQGLTADNLQSGDPSLLNMGLRFTGDPQQLSALYDKITTLIEGQGGQSLAVSKVDAADGMALATNDSYASTLAGLDGRLADSDVFRSVITDAASKEFVLFFNWDAIESQAVDALQSSSGSAQTQQVIDNLTALRAVGITVETAGDYTESTLRISVNG